VQLLDIVGMDQAGDDVVQRLVEDRAGQRQQVADRRVGHDDAVALDEHHAVDRALEDRPVRLLRVPAVGVVDEGHGRAGAPRYEKSARMPTTWRTVASGRTIQRERVVSWWPWKGASGALLLDVVGVHEAAR
jgi:hypothetical protein